MRIVVLFFVVAVCCRGVCQASFLDDFSIDSSANYTLSNPYGSGGTFAVSGGTLNITTGYENTATVMTSETVDFSVGNKLCLDVPPVSINQCVFMTVSTTAAQPNGSSSYGFRFRRGGGVVRIMRYPGGEGVNTDDPDDTKAAILTVTRITDSDFDYSIVVEGAQIQLGTFTLSELASITSLHIGAQAYALSSHTFPFDNLQVQNPSDNGFLYQGRLMDAGNPADGLYDLRFALYEGPNAAPDHQIGDTFFAEDIDILDGYFTTELDFGSEVFGGEARWLEIAVRTWDSADPNDYVSLSPLQSITPTPYALYSRTAAHAETAAYAETASPDNDWIVSGDDMYSMPSGNVGIGTDAPAGKLDVAATPGPSGSPILDQQNTSNNYSAYDYVGTWQSFTPQITGYLSSIEFFTLYVEQPINNGTLTIYQGGGTGGSVLASQQIIIDNSSWGWVAVSFSNPPFLESGQVYTFRVYTSPYAYGVRYSTDNPYAGGRFSISANYDTVFETYMDAPVDLSSFMVSSEGNVGIGTTSPAAPLDVIGNAFLSGKVGIGTTSPSTKLQVNTSTQYDGLSLVYDTSGNPVGKMALDGDTGYLNLYSGGTANISFNAAGDSFFNGGNLGIGKTNPTAALDVNGTAKISTANITTANITTANILAWYDQSVSTNGYTWVGNILFEWGSGTSSSDDNQTFTFPIPFPNQCFSITINRKSAGAASPLVTHTWDTTGFSIDRENNIDGSVNFNYIAIGY